MAVLMHALVPNLPIVHIYGPLKAASPPRVSCLAGLAKELRIFFCVDMSGHDLCPQFKGAYNS